MRTDENDTRPENEADIGEQPTLRWLRCACPVEGGAPVTVRFGSGAALTLKPAAEPPVCISPMATTRPSRSR